MALVSLLVIEAGKKHPRLRQPDDVIGDSGALILVANQAIRAGQPVYQAEPGRAGLCQAGDPATLPASGLALAAAGVGGAVPVQTDGLLILTDWSAVTEPASQTLVAGRPYLVSAAGKLTLDLPPTGQFLAIVGRACAADRLRIAPAQPIKLL